MGSKDQDFTVLKPDTQRLPFFTCACGFRVFVFGPFVSSPAAVRAVRVHERVCVDRKVELG